MVKVFRSQTTVLGGLLLVSVCAVAVWVCQREISIAYHRWAMNSAYNELFGNPEPIGNGLASNDVTGVDVDAVLERYARHRQRLVEEGDFFHARESLPHLSVTSDQRSHIQRSNFVHRMCAEFPAHKHYFLSRDGTFEVWDVVENENRWKAFFFTERKRDDDEWSKN